MSVHVIFYQQGHKMMEAVATEEAYRRYRDSQAQQRWVETIRHPKPETDVSAAKRKLCLLYTSDAADDSIRV